MTNTKKEEDTDAVEFIRRKLSLTASHDNQMQKLSNEHYGGNSSQFVRSAIEDHARTINGVNENLLRQLSDEVLEIKEMIERIDSQIDQQNGKNNNHHEFSDSDSSTDPQLITREGSLDNEALKIYQLLAEDHPDQRTVSSIVSNVSLSEDAVDRALVNLKTRGDIISKTIDNVRYYTISRDEATIGGGNL